MQHQKTLTGIVFFIIYLFVLSLSNSSLAQTNLIRNGNFEGGLLYWHNQDSLAVVKEGKVGDYALRINSGWTLSAPFVAESDAIYTISLWARTITGSGRINIGMAPTAREVAVNARRIWHQDGGKEAELTTEWKRIAVSWKADVPQNGFWPYPHYGIVIDNSNQNKAILVDGVTVIKGEDKIAPDYIPRRPVEVLADPTNLPGWDGAKGNLYEKGAVATLNGYVSNPGSTSQTVTARWLLMDYEGVKAWSDPIDEKITLSPGQTRIVPTQLPLTATGTVIARLSALDSAGQVIDVSDLPLTSLAYPETATQNDYRERFGGSFAGAVGCLEKMQRIGFGWCRWWPENKWHNFQPTKDTFNWQQEKFDEAFHRGIACHIVLYGEPKWANDGASPLPNDMRWAGDDPRWNDDTIETSWDTYIKTAVRTFKGKPVIFQIANEPGHDKRWHDMKEAYVQFNLRTARLIKMTDPDAKVSLNNVYGNPSPPNAALLATGRLQNFDVWSWHDYRAGWLLDAQGIRRMRQMLDEAGGKHMQIWFTEGWMYTNTLVDQPPACTHLDSVQSAHAVSNSIAEITAIGHDKVIMFHLLYETHGQSFWDYSGPGVMLWDWYQYPLPTLAVWNSLNYHIGLSDRAGFVRPPGANLCIFQDLRHHRGVMIAYADRNSKQDAVIELPIHNLMAEDIMGNPVTIVKNQLILSKTERPVVLYATDDTTGRVLYQTCEPLDRKYLGFVSSDAAGRKIYRIPDIWEGEQKNTAKGNPVHNDGRPVWRIDRLYPNDRIMPNHYTPMVWGNQCWIAPDHTHGGHPSATVKDGIIRFGAMGPWNGNDTNFKKQGALVFIVPDTGLYHLQATASSQPWGGSQGIANVFVMKRDEQRVGVIKQYDLPPDNSPVAIDIEIDAATGHELILLVEMAPYHNSSNISLKDIVITRD